MHVLLELGIVLNFVYFYCQVATLGELIQLCHAEIVACKEQKKNLFEHWKSVNVKYNSFLALKVPAVLLLLFGLGAATCYMKKKRKGPFQQPQVDLPTVRYTAARVAEPAQYQMASVARQHNRNGMILHSFKLVLLAIILNIPMGI